MSQCLMCGKSIGFLQGHKILNGDICQSCYGKIPSVLHKSITEHNDIGLKMICECMEINALKGFDASANYGSLYIDERKGLFAIKENKKTWVFDTLDVQDVSIDTTHIKADNTGKVHCDIELQCQFESPNMFFKTAIKKDVLCKSTRIDKTHVTWDIPGEVDIIRSVFNQTIKNAVERFNKENVPQEGVTKYQLNYIKAKALFMVEDGYELSEIKKQRDLLLSIYHPDNRIVEDVKYAQIINNAYDLLSEAYGRVPK